MFKSNKAKKIVAASVCVLTMGGMMLGANAADPKTGTTPVVYDNRQVLPDNNAQYGIIIPTGITFTNESGTGSADLAIVGINGYDLKKDWEKLTVSATVASQNGYKLVGEGSAEGSKAGYTLTMDGNTGAFTADNKEQAVTKTLGIGDGSVDKITGTAKLTEKATKKGVYKDTLTYKFTETANNRK